MIFRRIKAHIEKENWFAVLVDFLIVVSILVPTLRVVMHRVGLMRNLYQILKLEFVSFSGGLDYKMEFKGMHYHAGAWEREVVEDTP
jgi:hypothetical protein